MKRTRVGHVVHAVIAAFVLVEPEQQDHTGQQDGGRYKSYVQRHVRFHDRFGSRWNTIKYNDCKLLHSWQTIIS